MEKTNSKRYRTTFRVGLFDTDFKNKVKLTSVCNFLQEIAGMHSDALHWSILDLLKNGQSWVLSRLKIKILKYPKWLDEVVVETWPVRIDGLLCYRDFKIYNTSGELLMIASSAWLVIDFKTKRLVRPSNIISFDDFVPDSVFDTPLQKLKINIDNPITKQIQVQYSDLDMNQHVNNVKYVKWVIDACELDFIENHIIESIEINFLKEAKYNDTIVVHRGKCINNRQQFEIRNKEGDKVHCTAVIEWKEGKLI